VSVAQTLSRARPQVGALASSLSVHGALGRPAANDAHRGSGDECLTRRLPTNCASTEAHEQDVQASVAQILSRARPQVGALASGLSVHGALGRPAANDAHRGLGDECLTRRRVDKLTLLQRGVGCSDPGASPMHLHKQGPCRQSQHAARKPAQLALCFWQVDPRHVGDALTLRTHKNQGQS